MAHASSGEHSLELGNAHAAQQGLDKLRQQLERNEVQLACLETEITALKQRFQGIEQTMTKLHEHHIAEEAKKQRKEDPRDESPKKVLQIDKFDDSPLFKPKPAPAPPKQPASPAAFKPTTAELLFELV